MAVIFTNAHSAACDNGTGAPLHITDVTSKSTTVKRGSFYPKNAAPGEGSINGLPASFHSDQSFLRGSRLLHCSPQLGQVITLKPPELFQRSRAYFFLLIKKKMDELAELPLAGTWSQVSE